MCPFSGSSNPRLKTEAGREPGLVFLPWQSVSVCFHYRSQLQFKLKVVDLSDQWPKLNSSLLSHADTTFHNHFLRSGRVTSGPSLTELSPLLVFVCHRAAQRTFPFSTWDSAKTEQESVDGADPCGTNDNGHLLHHFMGFVL